VFTSVFVVSLLLVWMQKIAVSMSVSVSRYVWSLACLWTTCPNFRKFSVHVGCDQL